ncbi:hypothetical protein MRX96_058330 [Rhipicephalus microplus]
MDESFSRGRSVLLIRPSARTKREISALADDDEGTLLNIPREPHLPRLGSNRISIDWRPCQRPPVSRFSRVRGRRTRGRGSTGPTPYRITPRTKGSNCMQLLISGSVKFRGINFNLGSPVPGTNYTRWFPRGAPSDECRCSRHVMACGSCLEIKRPAPKDGADYARWSRTGTLGEADWR